LLPYSRQFKTSILIFTTRFSQNETWAMPKRQIFASFEKDNAEITLNQPIGILFVFIYPYAYNLTAAAKINPR
jgi:hypothetical protein